MSEVKQLVRIKKRFLRYKRRRCLNNKKELHLEDLQKRFLKESLNDYLK